MRGHIRSIELADGPSPSALVHDFHVYEIVPSVAFAAKVPDSPKDSFYCGKAFIGLKYLAFFSIDLSQLLYLFMSLDLDMLGCAPINHGQGVHHFSKGVRHFKITVISIVIS